ncbi:serine hydrolase [Bradymonas sediminis]|nr:serine hydrolase [Bradymonas sediminis]TDP77330.1 CubicO group peptidase (beta-lactamase class C family) [Bradymonas sediminis]
MMRKIVKLEQATIIYSLARRSVVLAVVLALGGCGTVDESTRSDVDLGDATSETDASRDAGEADVSPDMVEEENVELLTEAQVERFERLVANEGHPTIVVGVIEGDATRVYGFGTRETGEAPDGATLYEIGSVTKTFTGLLLAQAVESAEFSLNAPVQDLLPDFQIPTRNGKEITLEMLATHHSGLPRMPSGVSAADPSGYDSVKLNGFLENHTLTRDPGASYEYSNLGFGLLGYALGAHAGVGYKAAVEREIIEPLGLTSTYTSGVDAPSERLEPGYTGAGVLASNLEFQALAGAGSIVSGADDLLTYLRANMGMTDSSLNPAMQLALQARVDITGPNDRIGLAWKTNSVQGHDMMWHSGVTNGYTTFVGFLSDGSYGLVILTNIAKPLDTMGITMLLEGVAGDDDTIELSVEELDEYVGKYSLSAQMKITIFREGSDLMAQATGQGAFPIYASAKDKFFARIAPIEITFERDAEERVDGLILHQNGENHPAPRMPEE